MAPLLDLETVRDLLRTTPPCVSIFVPPLRPGAQSPAGQATLIRNLLDQAGEELTRRNVSKREVGALLDPLAKLAQNPDWSGGCQWTRTVFRSPALCRDFVIRDTQPQWMAVGERFWLLPALAEFETPREFYLLKLSRKRASLARVGITLESVPLPGKIPETLDEFLEFEAPDHDLENRNAVGGAAGAARRVRFGTGSERETQQAHIRDFYRAVDRAVTDGLQRAGRPPLLLAGVDEDTALYRSASGYSNLAARSLSGSPGDGATDSEMLQRGYAELRRQAEQRAAESLRDSRERLTPARFSTKLASIAQWAAEGRVGLLFVNAALPERSEALNIAVAETVSNSGSVSLVPATEMQDVAAAALRY